MNKTKYLRLIKLNLIFLMFLTLSSTSVKSAIDEGIGSENYFDENPDVFVVVEKPYRHLFNKKIFTEEVQRIEKALELDGGKTQLMEFTIKSDQDLFVSRYFKKMMYDAFMKDNKVFIYTKRSTPN